MKGEEKEFPGIKTLNMINTLNEGLTFAWDKQLISLVPEHSHC